MYEGPSYKVIARAADWAATLDSDEADQQTHDACEAWCRENPMHRLALDRMRSIGARFEGLDDIHRQTLRAVAGRPRRKKSRLGLGAVAGCILMVAGWAASQTYTVREMMAFQTWAPPIFADVRTAIGEQQSVTLVDQSTLVVDTNSTVATNMAGRTRALTLFSGRVLATVASDPARPFVVETRDGTTTALGTVFAVNRGDDTTIITVVESAVRVCPRATPAQCRDVHAGQRVHLTAAQVSSPESIDATAETAWSQGWLAVDDRPLSEVLTELARYHPMPIRYNAADVVGRRVTGSYPLAASSRALAAIAEMTGLTLAASAREVRLSAAR